jgi:hypothetical protein
MSQPQVPLPPPPTLQWKVHAFIDGVRGRGSIAIEPGRITFVPDRMTSALGGTAVEQHGRRAVIACPKLLPPPWRRWLVITDGVHTASISLTGRRDIEALLQNGGFEIELHPSWASVSRGVVSQRRRRVLPSAPEWLDRLTGFSKSSGGLVLAILCGVLLVAAVLLFIKTFPSEERISQTATVGSLLVGGLLGVWMGFGSKRANAIVQWSGLIGAIAVGVAILSSSDAGSRVFGVAVVVGWSATGVSIVTYAARRLRR